MPKCSQCVAGLLKLSRRPRTVPKLVDRPGKDGSTSTKPDLVPVMPPSTSLAIFGACLEKAASDAPVYKVRWPSGLPLDSESSASEDDGIVPQKSALRLQRAERFHIGAVPECFQISSEPENQEDLRERERRLALRRLNVSQRPKRMQRGGCRGQSAPCRCRGNMTHGLGYKPTIRGQNSSPTDEEGVVLLPLAAIGGCQRQPQEQQALASHDHVKGVVEELSRANFRFQEGNNPEGAATEGAELQVQELWQEREHQLKVCMAQNLEKLGQQHLSDSFGAWRHVIASERKESICAARWALRGSLMQALSRVEKREHAAKQDQQATGRASDASDMRPGRHEVAQQQQQQPQSQGYQQRQMPQRTEVHHENETVPGPTDALQQLLHHQQEQQQRQQQQQQQHQPQQHQELQEHQQFHSIEGGGEDGRPRLHMRPALEDLRSLMECAKQQPPSGAAVLREVVETVLAIDVVKEPKEVVETVLAIEAVKEVKKEVEQVADTEVVEEVAMEVKKEAHSPGLEPRSGEEKDSDAYCRRECSLAQLTNPQVWRKLDLNPAEREMHLSDQHFEDLFGMKKDEFRVLPKWRRHSLKKRHGLF